MHGHTIVKNKFALVRKSQNPKSPAISPVNKQTHAFHYHTLLSLRSSLFLDVGQLWIAVDYRRFGKHICSIFDGQSVKMPTYAV